MPKKLFLFLLSSILIFALFVRFFRLGQVPYSLYWDEQAMMVDIKSVLDTGKDMFGRPWYQVIYPSYGDFKLPVYIWSATVASKLFGLSEWSLRLPSALAGIGTVVVAGLLTRFIVNQQKKQEWQAELAQLFTMFVVSVTPWSVMFSRTGFEGHIGQFLVALSVLLLFYSKKKPWLASIAALIGGLATYAYFSVRFVWIVVFGLVQLWVIYSVTMDELQTKKKKTIDVRSIPLLWWGKKLLILCLVPAILFAVTLVPMFRSPIYGDANRFRLGTDSILKNDEQVMQSNVYRELAGNSRVDRVIFHRMWLTTQELMKNYSDHLSLDFLFVSGDTNLRHGTTQHGVFLLVFLPFFVWGWFWFAKERRGILLILLGWWMIALLPASVPENTPHALRSLNALVPLSIVIGVGFMDVANWLRQRSPQLKWSGAGVMAVMLGFSTFTFFYHYFAVYPQESAEHWQDGYKQLAQAIYQKQQAGEEVVILPFDDRFYLWLMVYGPYTGKDFQGWQSQEYKFEKVLPNVRFQEIEVAQLQQMKKPVVVLGKPDQMEKLLRAASASAASSEKVLGGDGKVRFVIKEFYE